MARPAEAVSPDDRNQICAVDKAFDPLTQLLSLRPEKQHRIAKCMQHAGYRPDLDRANCKMEALSGRSPFCYAPEDFWQRTGYRLEMLFRGGPASG
jgi:hypothetical protein